MTNFVIIRAHGGTVKDTKETVNSKTETIIFQCNIGEKIPYWSNLQDGALGFIKKCISLYPNNQSYYRYKTNEEIPKTFLSGINKIEYDTCYIPFSNWILKEYKEEKTDCFISNGFFVIYSLFIKNDNQILHCTIGGSTESSTLGALINTLKQKFPDYDNVWIVPVCRTFVDDINNADTPIIESSGHFSYKTLQNKQLEYSEEDILSAIERNDTHELNSIFFHFLKNNEDFKKENLKQKVVTDYKGLNLPEIAEKVLDYIDMSLFGEYESFEDF